MNEETMTRFATRIACALFLLSIATLSRAAALEVTLDHAVVTAAPRDTVPFSGTLRNPGPVGTPPVFLNADVLTVDLPLSGDDSAFVSLLLEFPPPSLGPGESLATDLFAIQVPQNAAPGTYLGAFDVLGGETLDDMNLLGEATFEVHVVPEPPSGLLVFAISAFAIVLIPSRKFGQR
jgi:hypothetical protein